MTKVAIDPSKEIRKIGVHLSQDRQYIWGLKLLDAQDGSIYEQNFNPKIQGEIWEFANVDVGMEIIGL